MQQQSAVVNTQVLKLACYIPVCRHTCTLLRPCNNKELLRALQCWLKAQNCLPLLLNLPQPVVFSLLNGCKACLLSSGFILAPHTLWVGHSGHQSLQPLNHGATERSPLAFLQLNHPLQSMTQGLCICLTLSASPFALHSTRTCTVSLPVQKP